MNRPIQTILLLTVTTIASADILVRPANFTVPPSTGPITHIIVQNTSDQPATATIQPKFPTGWKWSPAQQTVTLQPGQTQQLPFTIEKALDLQSNSYPVEVTLTIADVKTVHSRNVFTASAPHLKPKTDADLKDFIDAIPITFTTADRKPADLDRLLFKDAQLAVKRKANITIYECAIPFAAIGEIKPDTGREFRFSLLIHDPDGTGIRDLGKSAGLSPDARNPLAWTPWSTLDFKKNPPQDSKTQWGLCSSKH